MIIDTSALMAILKDEPDARMLAESLYDSRANRISTGTALELSLVAGHRLRTSADRLLDRARVETVPFDQAQLSAAKRAHATYGRGSGSPARLNFGDCFSYALAITRDEPLLFKGEDFTHTDVRPAK